ncbi:MAG: hypothetical protein M1828_002472 [Chrysothrix sp. TS-e1954]|nr:MAG: hypothetical protein M1828_002472 [Chrysothrix sp. TS-e1954]
MVKWTPEKDQLLLLKILETHELSVDAKRVSAAWPGDQEDIPTARAITERLVKIRQIAKAKGAAGHFNISSSQAKGIATPRKPTVTVSAATPSQQKTPTSKSVASPSTSRTIKQEDAAATPTKRKAKVEAPDYASSPRMQIDEDEASDVMVIADPNEVRPQRTIQHPNAKKGPTSMQRTQPTLFHSPSGSPVARSSQQMKASPPEPTSTSLSQLRLDPRNQAEVAEDMPSPPKRPRYRAPSVDDEGVYGSATDSDDCI